MSDMYTDVERSIQQTLVQALTAAGLNFPVFNNQVSKKAWSNFHGAITIMRTSDVFAPANGGGQSAYLKTPVLVNGAISSYTVQDWPDPFDIVYSFTIEAETSTAAGVTTRGLDRVRSIDALLRSAFRPRRRMMLWDSTLKSGAGDWSTNFVNYIWAGYINRDIPDQEVYNRVTNIRFEVFNYNTTTTTEPAIRTVPTLNIVPIA